MPRNTTVSIENSFVRGHITEATGLNFPENACTDTDNCIFNQTGTVERRTGIDAESPLTPVPINRDGVVLGTYRWSNVAGDGGRTIIVIQIGTILSFFEVGIEVAVAGGELADTIDLATYKATGAPSPGTVECQYSSGNGLLFVTHPYCEAFYVSYDPADGSLTDTQIDLKIRDFEGDSADTLAVDERPTSTLAALSAAHNYNLRNQGWTTANLTAWDTAQTTMPSNADVSWYFKDANDAFDFSSASIASVLIGNTPAPKGHFILDVYDQDRTDASGVSGATGFSTGFQRCSTSAFFAGRVFYAGLSVEGYNSSIFFSQIIERPDQYGKAHQSNDPTSELLFDLLPSDGGVIKILDAGLILKMIPVQGQLIVFCNNGIWAISGSEGLGFSAVDYTVTKVSSTRSLSHTSYVDIEGIPMWWSPDGIYTLQFQSSASTPNAVSLTIPTIKSFFDDIPVESKGYVRGTFNNVTKIVQWLYRSTNAQSVSERYSFDKILNLNTVTQAFYTWSIDPDADTTLSGIFLIDEFGGDLETFEVVTGAGGVDDVVSNTDNVVVIQPSSPSAEPQIYYVITNLDTGDWTLYFGAATDQDFVDFASIEDTAIDYESYFITGYKVRGQAQRKWQSNCVYLYLDNRLANRLTFQGRWDYANAGNTGRWTSLATLDIPEGSYDNVMRKLKVRGHGKALQYKVTSTPGEDFRIVGWSAYETQNQLP